jgi:hypothetical protein
MPDAEVTTAVLGTKIDHLTTQVKGLTTVVAKNTEASNDRLRFLETEQAVQRTEINTSKDEIKTLRKRDWIAYALTAIAAGLGIGWNR